MQARRVLLSWEPGSDGLSPVRYYTVQYRELPQHNWTLHSTSVSHEINSYTLDRYADRRLQRRCLLRREPSGVRTGKTERGALYFFVVPLKG